MIAGLVLAGGAASRMGGGDKTLLPLGTATILDQILARLAPQVACLAISANGDAARFAHWGLPVLPDLITGAGPLPGLAVGLQWAATVGADRLLTIPGDTPFFPRDLAARLAPAPAWADSGGALHPLVALWPVAEAPRLQAWLAAGGSRQVRAFGMAIAMRQVRFDDTCCHPAADPFANINTPADLAAAQARFAAFAPQGPIMPSHVAPDGA